MITMEEVKRLQQDTVRIAELKREQEREEEEKRYKRVEKEANEAIEPTLSRISSAIRTAILDCKHSIDVAIGDDLSGKLIAHQIKPILDAEGFSVSIEETFHPEIRGGYDYPGFDAHWAYRLIIKW